MRQYSPICDKQSDEHIAFMMTEAVCSSETMATAYDTTHCRKPQGSGMNFHQRKMVESETNKL
jgi:hypothetical protein